MARPDRARLAGALSVLALSHAAASQAPLTLEAAVDRARARNERVLSAARTADAAEADVARARAFFFPTLSVGGAYVHRSYESTREVGGETVVLSRRDALSAAATATQVLLDMRAVPLWRQSRSNRDAAALEAVDASLLVGFDTGAAFLTALGLTEAAAAADRRLEVASASLRDATARFDAQIASSNDVTRAQLEVASAERERTRAVNAVAEARLNLGYLLDEALEGALATPEPLLDPEREEAGPAEGLVAEAVSRRVDLAAQRKRVEALRFYAKEPMNRYVPALTARGDVRTTNDAGLSGRDTVGTFSLDLSWSLFDGLARHAEKAERTAQADAAELLLRAAERQVDLDVRRALVAIGNARAGIRQARVAADVARRNAEETAELYRQGLATAFALADANVRLFEAEVALVRERIGLGLARLDLRAATGLDPLGKEVP
ncbi:MAG: TolC family protein [Acidobacteria bacterium]|nr:MAG: TolC family protein [Acidobacteriota bacterium]MCE7957052.1 TolC family protein [Acidobacteria bacterium ACB2]